MTGYEQLQIDLMQSVIDIGFADKGLKFILVNSDTWDYDLPDGLNESKTIVLDISGTSLEDSYQDQDGVFIQTAFGDDVYSRHFNWDEIIQIITFEGVLLYQKVMHLKEKEITTPEIEDTQPKGKIPRKITPENLDEDLVKVSMSKMMEKNSHLRGRKK